MEIEKWLNFLYEITKKKGGSFVETGPSIKRHWEVTKGFVLAEFCSSLSASLLETSLLVVVDVGPRLLVLVVIHFVLDVLGFFPALFQKGSGWG